MAPHRACQRWALLVIILLAFVLRVYDLGRGPLWFDEALSGVVGAKGWEGIVAHSFSTPFEHPPLYYMALHLWMVLAGKSSFALRFFSVFWGVLLIPLLYSFISPWGGRRLAFLTALLAAISATHVDQSQNARMYTLVVFLGVLSLFLFFRALQDSRRFWLAGYLLVTGLGIAIHYYFALLLLVPIIFLLQSGSQYRRLLVFFALILLGSVLLASSWLLLSPGPRQAIQQILRGEGAGASSLVLRVRYTIGGLLLEEPAAGHLALGILALVGVFFWPLLPPPRTQPVRLVGSRRFLLIWLVVPWLAALAIPYWLQGRHLAYLWPALFALAAAGLLALRSRSVWLFLVALVLLAVISIYGLHRLDTEVSSRPDFGQMFAYVEDRALPGDLVVMNQPSMWPFVDYYSDGDLQFAYIPETPALTEEEVAQQLESLVEGQSRIWLGPISSWTADPESFVERWLDTNTYQAYKEWFRGDGSAALYFASKPLDRLPLGRVKWEDGIRLLRAHSSSLNVVPGDAICLALQWQTNLNLDDANLVSLDLVDEQGLVWASRRSEPCSGWCPTDTWQPGEIYQDLHALLVARGTPPGSYQLQLSLYTPAEGREAAVKGNGPRINLGVVEVTRSDRVEKGALPEPVIPHPMRAEFGGQVALLGFDLAQPEIRADETILLDMHWLALTSLSTNYTLRLELVDTNDQVAAAWDRPPAGAFFPTSNWQAGEYLRGPQQLSLPGQVLPGRYRLRLKVLDGAGQPLPLDGSRPRQALDSLLRWDAELNGESLELASLWVSMRPDRIHSFDLPVISRPLYAQLGEQVELLGYDLGTEAAMPGGHLDLTLYWRARGATDQPYKVFTHLGDGLHPPVAQDDAPPGKGCCPTNTWVEGEVVVDPHVIPLPDNLPPGEYQLMAGLYDESSGQRLPVVDAVGHEVDGQQLGITEVTIRPVPTAEPAAARLDMSYRIYLPLVEDAW